MITSIDDTSFQVDFLDMYQSYLKSFLLTKIMGYGPSDFNQTKQHQFNVLFETPANMVSNFFTTDFFISTMLINGVQVREKQDIEGGTYTDVTDADSQIYFQFDQ